MPPSWSATKPQHSINNKKKITTAYKNVSCGFFIAEFAIFRRYILLFLESGENVPEAMRT